MSDDCSSTCVQVHSWSALCANQDPRPIATTRCEGVKLDANSHDCSVKVFSREHEHEVSNMPQGCRTRRHKKGHAKAEPSRANSREDNDNPGVMSPRKNEEKPRSSERPCVQMKRDVLQCESTSTAENGETTAENER